MTNFEKYRDEIIKIQKYSANDCLDFVIPNVLEPMDFDCDNISCDTCHRLFSVWLLNEYKEPEKPEVDWSKISVDTKIYVKDKEEDKWIKRYFAKYEKGKVYTWMYGNTSWISDGIEIESWEYAKLAEDEEV
jgi:hypothetical protein